MPPMQNSEVNPELIIVAIARIGSIVVATALSAFNGNLSLLTVLVFSDHESTRMWVSICLPATLWIVAIICYWFPKSGFAAYAVILAASILVCVNPMYRDNICFAAYRCSDDLRFAIAGGAFLLVNFFIPKKQGRTSKAQAKPIAAAEKLESEHD